MVLGHDLGAGHRTQDVRISDDVSFDTMLLRKATLKGLKKAGFLKPSPVQLHGIPLGKCGFDLLLEAKSGTGKTAVFTVISLEKLDLDKGVQTIILAPTREIASQISAVISEIGSQYKGLNVAVVMGGLPVKEDVEKFNENVHIVVGSPGRLRHLIQDKHIDLSSVRLIVLDEADKLMEKSFLPDFNYIFSLLPKQKQVIMSSATYSEETKKLVGKYSQKAQHVCPDSNSVLLGIEQKVAIVPYNSNIVKQTKYRYEELKKILNSKQFKQCLIFCNYQVRVGELHRMLSRDKWPAEQLYGQQEQTDRLDALKTLQEYKCRILVSTDLAARGIDASNVDVVINFEPPYEWQTYLHRIGRAGRYGSYGTAISILSEGKEKTKFKEMLALTNMQFNLRYMCSDDPFNLSVIDDTLEKDEEPDAISASNAKLQNGDDSENMLWKSLTGSLEQNDTKPEISSFNELCDSFKISSEPNIETFSDLMHSFKLNQNKISNSIDGCEFKHVKVTKLPIDGGKYWDNLDTNYTKQVKGLRNVDTLINIRTRNATTVFTNGDSVNEKKSNKNERFLTEGMEKENSVKYLSECVELASPKIITYKDTKPNNNISDAPDILQKDLERRSDEIKIDLINQTLINIGLPTAFGKNIQVKRPSRIKKYHDPKDDYESRSSESEIDPIEIAVIDANFPNAFGIKNRGEGHSNDNEINTSENDIDPNERTLVDAAATILENNTENDPIKEALINAGLPTAFGKIKQNNNHGTTHRFYHSNDNKTIKIEKSKAKPIQQKPIKIQEIDRKKTKQISSSKTFTREDCTQKCLSTTVVESDTSNSSESSYNEKKTSNLRNYYEQYGSTYKRSSWHHHHYKKHSKNMEQIRENQFDNWYKQFKQQTNSIQYALYIEELRKP